MTYILTRSGYKFNFESLNSNGYDIDDIAHSLSNLCRFVGHCPKFYSVAEHCCHCYDLALLNGFGNKELKPILLHDAHEAYIGDIARPIKHYFDKLEDISKEIDKNIETIFNTSFERNSDLIKFFDDTLLRIELSYMFHYSIPKPTIKGYIIWCDHPIDVKIKYWKPAKAKKEFLKRYWLCQ